MLTAIPTFHANHLFRSRLEARWSIFFDSLEIPWEYEKDWAVVDETPAKWSNEYDCYVEDYEADPCDNFDQDRPTIKTGYCPDFYLPKWNLWLEIKPTEPNNDAKLKARRWSLLGRGNILIVFQELKPISIPSDANYLYHDGKLHTRFRWIQREGHIGIAHTGDAINDEGGDRIRLAYIDALSESFTSKECQSS